MLHSKYCNNSHNKHFEHCTEYSCCDYCGNSYAPSGRCKSGDVTSATQEPVEGGAQLDEVSVAGTLSSTITVVSDMSVTVSTAVHLSSLAERKTCSIMTSRHYLQIECNFSPVIFRTTQYQNPTAKSQLQNKVTPMSTHSIAIQAQHSR